MPWGSGGKSGMGGNPGKISRNAGDLPPDTSGRGGGGRTGGLDLTSVLMGRGVKVANRGGVAQAPMMQIPADWKLPEWIHLDAHICYISTRTGEKFEVVVEMVNTAKNEVEVSGPGGIRIIPFAVIASAANPLHPPEVLPKKVEEGPNALDLTEDAHAVAKPTDDCVDLTDERASRSRSRSPRK
eukprot:TRINITY_DN83036_c0_g1_i1.p1 TRINITY_DN83036_c0_g1~~TRINITY_DN83036_c0_g1_i1.p1  ORF type:complete len:184 (+),score=31.45 TRINITY_DN83036_c0_g1_i1:59-610(+)